MSNGQGPDSESEKLAGNINWWVTAAFWYMALHYLWYGLTGGGK